MPLYSVKHVIMLGLAGFLLACGATVPVENTSRVSPKNVTAEVQAAEPVSGGLRVWYQVPFKKRSLKRMRPPGRFKDKARSGKPVPYLDHAFGTGKIFESGSNKKVGVLLEGFLRFDQRGIYRIKVLSNDGVRVFLKNKLIIDDPEVHSNHWAATGPVVVGEPGWYPLRVQYFQGKGTATLRLHWKLPEADTFGPIPASAYGHGPVSQ